ncbi:hypothetical protein D3C84_1142260 [compost metagenome]
MATGAGETVFGQAQAADGESGNEQGGEDLLVHGGAPFSGWKVSTEPIVRTKIR